MTEPRMYSRVAVETLTGKWADFASFHGGDVTARAAEFATQFTIHDIPVRIIIEPEYDEEIPR